MTTKEEWDNFAKEVVPTLKNLGYIKSKKWKTISLIVLWLLTLGLVYNVTSEGYFQSTTNQNVTLEPNIAVNPNIENSYKFDTPINNDYNHTINVYNNIFCPNE